MSDITAIFEIISSLSSTLALDEILANFSQKTADYLTIEGCTIARWDRESDTLSILANYTTAGPGRSEPDKEAKPEATFSPASYPVIQQVLQEQLPLVLYGDDPNAADSTKQLLRNFAWAGVLLVPMIYKEETIGLLTLLSRGPNPYRFSPTDIALGQAIANQAAVAIENTRLYEETEEARLHAETMQVVSRVLASELDYQNIINSTANFAYRLVYAQAVYLARPAEAIFPPGRGQARPTGLQPVVMVGRGKRDAAATLYENEPAELPGREILAQARQRPIFISDIQHDPTFTSARNQAKAEGWRALIAVPLLSYDELLGILAAYADQPNFFKPNDVAVLMSLASQAAVAIQNARLFAEIEAQRRELRQVSLRLVNAQEEERRRISRELHDEMGQALTALKINLDLARRAMPPDPPELLQSSIQEASALAKHTLESARNLSLELHPAILNDLGLVAALRWELDRYEQRLQIPVHFEATLGEGNLQPELEITVYRIIIEALTNIARHAQAGRVSVQLQQEAAEVIVQIQDDGIGFEVQSWLNTPHKRSSLGLVGMRERTQILGGRLNIISTLGQGTTVVAHLPIVPLAVNSSPVTKAHQPAP